MVPMPRGGRYRWSSRQFRPPGAFDERTAGHARQQLEPAAADAVRAYAAKTRENADQFAAVLEGVAYGQGDGVAGCGGVRRGGRGEQDGKCADDGGRGVGGMGETHEGFLSEVTDGL